MPRRKDVTKLPIGEQIRTVREKRGVSIYQLVADSKGTLSRGAVSRVETGSRYPSLDTLEALAANLKCRFIVDGKRTYIAELEDPPKG